MTESEISNHVQTPVAAPEPTQNQAQIQSKSDSLNERWTEVQSEMGSKIKLVSILGNVAPNILVRIEISEKPNSDFLCPISTFK